MHKRKYIILNFILLLLQGGGGGKCELAFVVIVKIILKKLNDNVSYNFDNHV